MNTANRPVWAAIGAKAAELLAPLSLNVRRLLRGRQDFDFSRPYPQERPGFRRSLLRLQAGKLIEKARIRIVTERGPLIRFYGADGTEYEGIALFSDMEHELKETICAGVDVKVIVVELFAKDQGIPLLTDDALGIPLLEIVAPAATVVA